MRGTGSTQGWRIQGEPPVAPAWDEKWAEGMLEAALEYIAERDALRPYGHQYGEFEARLTVPREAGDRRGYEAALREMIRECLRESGATSS